MAFVETRTGGYAMHLERPDLLLQHSTPLAYGADPSERRTEIRNDKWIKIENQSNLNACVGHGFSSAVEMQAVYQLSDIPQVSRFGAYRMAQEEGGMPARDNGAFISAACDAATKDGFPPESDWPYPKKYYGDFPPGFDDMPRWKVRGFSKLKTYDATWAHIDAFGPVALGISWLSCMDQAAANGAKLTSYSGRGGGGHCVCLGGLTKYDWDGSVLPGDLPWLVLLNSWAAGWANQGRLLVSPDAWTQMLNHQNSEMVGLFELLTPASAIKPPTATPI